MKSTPAVSDIPFIPTGVDQEIVFNSPWEAKAFALVVHMHQQGHFTWPEWAEQLSREIKAAGAEDDGSRYYLLWLGAAERLIAAKALCKTAELADRRHALEEAQGGPLSAHSHQH